MGSNTTYEYTAITAPRTIRLMHVHPGSGTDPVHLRLVTTALDAAPDFESISYCWGNAHAQDQRQVTCNGTTLSITDSLFTGLVHFRRANRSRVLWADAVCINQADAAEKGSQVLLMPYIYAQATSVLVWLGIADDPVYGSVPQDVLVSIRQASQLLPDYDPENAADTAAKVRTLRRDSRRLREEGRPNILDHDWMPLAALLARPWFRRRWVVQEVCLARHAVLYVGGGVEIPWTELVKFAFTMEGVRVSDIVRLELEKGDKETQKSHQGATCDGGMVDLERSQSWSLLDRLYLPLRCVNAMYMVQFYRHSGTLLDGLVCTMDFHCTDPRDHVYSLLSMVANGPTVQPDYEAPTPHVFRRFSTAMLVEGRSLKLLSLAPDRSIFSTPDTQRLEGLPSWVPDLRLMRADVLVSYTVRPQAFFAGGHAKPILSVSEDQRILTCQGRVIDTAGIFSVSLVEMILADIPEMRLSWKHILSDPILERSHNRLLQWVEGCYRLAFGHDLGSGAPVSRSVSPEFTMAFSRTMVCGIDSMRNRLSPELICEFPRYIQWAIDCAAADRDADMGQQHPVTKPSFSTMVDETVMALTMTKLKFCVTENGRFAQVPFNSQSGDSICVLVGGEVPFVIRPTGRGTYTLVGECYVDGVMDGETLEAVAGTTAELLETLHFE